MAKLGLPNFFDSSDEEEWELEEERVMMVIPEFPESSFQTSFSCQAEQSEQERSRINLERSRINLER